MIADFAFSNDWRSELVSTQKVVIDNCPCFRKCLLLGRSQDVTRPCSQKPTRAWIYLHPPTGSVLDGGQGVSSILNIICARFGHGIPPTDRSKANLADRFPWS